MSQPYARLQRPAGKAVYPPIGPPRKRRPSGPTTSRLDFASADGRDAVEIPARFEASWSRGTRSPFPRDASRAPPKPPDTRSRTRPIIPSCWPTACCRPVTSFMNAAGNFFVREKAGLRAALEKGSHELGVDVPRGHRRRPRLRRLRLRGWDCTRAGPPTWTKAGPVAAGSSTAIAYNPVCATPRFRPAI